MPAFGAAADDLDCAGGFDEPGPADAVPGGELSLGGSGGCRSRRAAEYAPATRRASAITAIISFFMEIAGARQVARGQSGIRRERVSMSAARASAAVTIRLSRQLDRDLHRWAFVLVLGCSCIGVRQKSMKKWPSEQQIKARFHDETAEVGIRANSPGGPRRGPRRERRYLFLMPSPGPATHRHEGIQTAEEP